MVVWAAGSPIHRGAFLVCVSGGCGDRGRKDPIDFPHSVERPWFAAALPSCRPLPDPTGHSLGDQTQLGDTSLATPGYVIPLVMRCGRCTDSVLPTMSNAVITPGSAVPLILNMAITPARPFQWCSKR